MHQVPLKEVALFAGLTADEIQRLGKTMEVRSFPANHTIFWAGDPGTDFYIIQSGRVHLSLQEDSGRESHLAALGPGDCFGEISLLDGGPRTATCRAHTDVALRVLSRAALLDFIRQNPAAAIHLLETAGRRQRETLLQLRSVRNPNQAVKETVAEGPLWPRIADKIAAVSASKQFLLLHVFLFAAWISYNLLAGEKAFDPFPFGLLTMSVSLEAIFLSIFVLVSANRQGEYDRIRAEVDHQVNLKAHHEVLELRRKIDALSERIGGGKDDACR